MTIYLTFKLGKYSLYHITGKTETNVPIPNIGDTIEIPDNPLVKALKIDIKGKTYKVATKHIVYGDSRAEVTIQLIEL